MAGGVGGHIWGSGLGAGLGLLLGDGLCFTGGVGWVFCGGSNVFIGLIGPDGNVYLVPGGRARGW